MSDICRWPALKLKMAIRLRQKTTTSTLSITSDRCSLALTRASRPFAGRLHHRSKRKRASAGQKQIDARSDQYWYVNKTYSEALAEQTVWDLIVATAEAMPERFWLPLNIEFRGRVYPIPHFNFTRDDRVRGLFLFADGKPVGEDGLRWLKAHVAARADGVTWSDHIGPRLNDLNFEDRIAWTDANSQLLLKIGKAVLDLDDPSTIAWALPKDEPC